MSSPESISSAERPNFVLILCDDMGYSDIGPFGAEIETPHLDALAAGGLRLTQMYNCARCCPTRAALLTGLYPHQAGIGHMVQNDGLPGYQGYLNDRCVTIAEALKAGGYRTYMSGKWHVGGRYTHRPEQWQIGHPEKPRPIDRGFDRFFGTLAGAGSYYNPHTLMLDDALVEPDSEDWYYTDAISDYAVRFIEEAAQEEEPFFLYIAYTAPHWPLHALPEDIAKYRGRYRHGWDALRQERDRRLIDAGLIDPKWTLSPRDPLVPAWEQAPDQEWEALRMAVYAAMIDRMDQGIGRIVAALRRHGLDENTLVLFLSDNGGCAEFLKEDGPTQSGMYPARDGKPVRIGNIRTLEPGGPHTFMSYDRPWANASNTPFRLYKHWVHEGGIATPCVVYWPRVIAPGGISHEPTHVIDVLPTFLEAAGVPAPPYDGRSVLPPEGESLLPLFRGERWSRRRPLFWEHEGNRAVRAGRWKLVSQHPGSWELYDVAEDRTELVDLADRFPDRVHHLAEQYQEWAERCGVLPWEELLAHRRRRRAGR